MTFANSFADFFCKYFYCLAEFSADHIELLDGPHATSVMCIPAVVDTS